MVFFYTGDGDDNGDGDGALEPRGGRIGFFDGSDGDGSPSKDHNLGCHRFMADGLGGRNRHHGIFLSSRFLDPFLFELWTRV